MRDAATRLGVADKLLYAAVALDEGGGGHFSAEDLVVAAWKMFPDTFGLRGHLEHPDSNRVFAEIMGSKPLRQRGHIEKLASKSYRLTQAGRARVRSLVDPDDEQSANKAGITREARAKLERLVSTRALEKYRNGRDEQITFHDACSFWGISPRSTANQYYSRTADVAAILNAMRDVMGGRPVVLEHGGREFTADDLTAMIDLDAEMKSRFAEEISVIIGRTDER